MNTSDNTEKSGDEPSSGNWQRAFLGNIRMQLCCSAKHPASKLPSPINQEQLAGFTHIKISDSARQTVQRTVNLMGIQRTLSVDSLSQKLSALSHGLGVSHLPEYCAAQAKAEGKLIILDTGNEIASQPFFMYWKKQQTGKANTWLREQVIEQQILSGLLQGLHLPYQ